MSSSVLFWGVHAVFALAALVPLFLALAYSGDYDLLHVPFASWFVFGLSGLILILNGFALYIRMRLRKTNQRSASVTREPTSGSIPAVYGHKLLGKGEFLPIVQSLFGQVPDARYIQLYSMPGGYGGSTTVLARIQQEAEGLPLPRSFAVKLGRRREMADEREKFKRYVRWHLTRRATLLEHAEWECWAGTAYEFVGMDPDHEIQSFHQFYQGHAIVEVSEVVEHTYAALDQAWYRSGETRTIDLYREYGLLKKKRQTIIEQVGELVDEDDVYRRNFTVVAEKLQPNLKPRFCSQMDAPWHDPVAFLRTWPGSNLFVPTHRSTVHGDLNARNILIEIGRRGQRLVWFIDFSHTGNGLSKVRTEEAAREGSLIDEASGHTLRDFSRLEADVKFILTRLCSDNDLSLAIAFEKELLDQQKWNCDMQPTSPEIEALRDPRFMKAWQVVREIRRQAADYLTSAEDWRPYWMSLLHATLPIVYYQPGQFEDAVCEQQQKRYALISAGMLCSQL